MTSATSAHRALGLVAALVMGCLVCLTTRPAVAQSEEERVQIIMTRPESAVPLRRSMRREFYEAMRRRSGRGPSRVLRLTHSEMWSVRKSKVEAIRQAARRHGMAVLEVGANRGGLLSPAAADIPMDDKRRLILEQARASMAIVGIKMSVMAPAGIVEYALT